MNIFLVMFVTLMLSSCGGLREVKTKPSVLKSDGSSKKLLLLQDIPQSCRNKNKAYQIVDTIFSKASYNEKAHKYKPIQTPKGFIASDFNHDGRLDYLFLERIDPKLGVDITLASCISSKKSYTRKTSAFKVHEVMGMDFQTISERIELIGRKLVLSISRHEHNWGSDSEVSTYSFDEKDNTFTLEQRDISSSSGDGMRSDTHELYDLVNKRYMRSNTCGWAEEGCAASKVSGRLIAPDSQVVLGSSSKVYKRLIPDK